MERAVSALQEGKLREMVFAHGFQFEEAIKAIMGPHRVGVQRHDL